MKHRHTIEADGSVRDRVVSPSINFPQSEEEAFQALLHGVRKALFGEDALRAQLSRTYTCDAGLGYRRSQEQADWLNQQQSLIRARIEDLLDELDLEHRITDVPDDVSTS